MQNQIHPWAQDYESFEAVLCCANEVAAWDQAATLRAYQTYGFDDASTKGNDLSFRHIDTGVLLLHDGEVVAIQFGDGNLASALSDLFLVLHGLGWRVADVFHPSETLGALMNDMGKAIPGHLDFDVRAAQDPSNKENLPPEAAEMVQLGASLMQTVATNPQDVNEFNALALDSLRSMAPDNGSQAPLQGRGSLPQSQGTQALPAAGPLQLDDDLEENFVDGGGSFIQSSFMQQPPMAVRASGQLFADDYDALPVVPVLGNSSTQSMAQPALSRSDLDRLSSHEILAESINPQQDHDFPMDSVVPQELLEDKLAPTALEPILQQRQMIAAPVVPDAPAQVARRADDQAMRSQPLDTSNGGGRAAAQTGALIRVGISALSFDKPDTPVSLDAVAQLAAEIRAEEVVHVWPGLLDQSERWDLIGEIDPGAPWFAEVLASVLEVHKPIERIWFAAALIQLAKQQKGAQLRDLLTKMNLDDLDLFKGGQNWFSACRPEDLENFASSAQSRFAGLLLSSPGEAFLDVQPAEGVCVRPFSVRSMVESPEAKLYVIHLDAVDGPFVEMTTNLLMTVAHRYSISTRARTQAQALQHEVERRESTQREAARQQVLAKVQETTAQLRELLQVAGLSAADLALPA